MSNYPMLNVFWTMLEFFLWILWFFLLFKILTDIFRNHDMSGGIKALWIIFVILLPFLGVLVYVIVNGRGMSQRDVQQAQQADAAFKKYVREAASDSGGSGGGASHVEELAKLADLRNSGALTDEEYQKAKDKLLA
ncbi:SHOCT domain-containing protein [Streptacidiphilus jiangxiensis]|uniref:Short C-terminal domain-containing protein n=1 Tax=Streptacidiphilus jiangxiensis TaxID=235985 RepID=A0A1H7HTH1_STRJI|nr:SHOCT domain-containing protein [Streptacidiphilus jiangxiensis]SEK52957.1 Short C-terminal domain-containing protein [Streptacidiphilus jiangxiensis]